MATIFCVLFHLMNSTLFSIGMFPWVCLAEMPLFYERNWPRLLLQWVFGESKQSITKRVKIKQQKRIEPKENNPSFHQKFVIFLVLSYCTVQITLPYSHIITKGYNNWTDGIYGYSWDMMMHAWDTILVVAKVRDNTNGYVFYLDPEAFAVSDRWTKHADMAHQYAKCIHDILTTNISNSFSIYFDVWCSLNGRFQQRVYDPTVDILRASWSPFVKPSWIKPLLSELTHMRSKISVVNKNVLAWNNNTDVMFIADFPNLTMEQFIGTDLTNVSLTVIQGSVSYRSGIDYVQNITEGQHTSIPTGKFHQIKTTSSIPASYMYSFVNNTHSSTSSVPDKLDTWTTTLWAAVSKRFLNFRKFLLNIGNSLIYELFSRKIL